MRITIIREAMARYTGAYAKLVGSAFSQIATRQFAVYAPTPRRETLASVLRKVPRILGARQSRGARRTLDVCRTRGAWPIRRSLLGILLGGLVGACLTGHAHAASFSCSQDPDDVPYYERDDVFWIEGIPTDRPYCRVAIMSGPLGPKDAVAFKEFLRSEPYTSILKAYSPGGSVEAAIEIGRIVRSRFMIVQTARLDTEKNHAQCRSIDHARMALANELIPEGNLLPFPLGASHPDPVLAEEASRKQLERIKSLDIDPARLKQFQTDCVRRSDCRVGERCCLSACVLVLVGSVYWDMGNVGLHRPSLKGLGSLGYDETTTRLQKVQQRIRDYLNEMSVPSRVYEAMMKVPPDEIQLLNELSASALFFGHSDNEQAQASYHRNRFGSSMPPSIYDWAIRACPPGGDRPYCLIDLVQQEFIKRATRPLQ